MMHVANFTNFVNKTVNQVLILYSITSPNSLLKLARLFENDKYDFSH